MADTVGSYVYTTFVFNPPTQSTIKIYVTICMGDINGLSCGTYMHT